MQTMPLVAWLHETWLDFQVLHFQRQLRGLASTNHFLMSGHRFPVETLSSGCRFIDVQKWSRYEPRNRYVARLVLSRVLHAGAGANQKMSKSVVLHDGPQEATACSSGGRCNMPTSSHRSLKQPPSTLANPALRRHGSSCAVSERVCKGRASRVGGTYGRSR